MADIDQMPAAGVPFRAKVDETGIAVGGTSTVAELTRRGMRTVCLVGSDGTLNGVTLAQLAASGIRAACLVDETGLASDSTTADQLRRRGIRPLVQLALDGTAGSSTMLQLARAGLEYACLVDETGTVSAGGAATASDNFNRANGSLGSNWVIPTGAGTPVISSNAVVSSGAGSAIAWSMAVWNPAVKSFGADQFSEVTIAGDYAGAVVHQQTGAVNGYLAAVSSANNIWLWRADGGALTQIGATTFATPDGSTLRLEITGTTLVVKINGVTRITSIDATYTTGQPGIAMYTGAVDNWSGGTIGGAPPPPLTPVVTAGNFGFTLPATNGQVVGTMTATRSPTSWTITAGNASGYFAISNVGVITVTPAGAAGLTTGSTQVLTCQATNAAGNGSGAATITVSPAPLALATRLATTNWQNAGLVSIGGIPTTRTQFGATLTPGGGNDFTQIQTALTNCPANRYVLLGAGTFLISTSGASLSFVTSNTTLRGSGAGVTIIKKTNGANLQRSATACNGTGPTTLYEPDITGNGAGGVTGSDGFPVVIIGSNIFNSMNSSVQSNLTADVAQGAMSVTVASATGFATGQVVLLDELSGASWQNSPRDNFAGGIKVWSGDRVTYNMHLPQQGGDDCGGSNAGGPYDGSPGTPPGVFGFYSRSDRPTNETKQIASIAGNVITFTSPVMISYRASHTAQLATGYVTPFLTGLGLENLTVQGGANGNVTFSCVSFSWMNNCESSYFCGNPGIDFSHAFRCELRHTYCHTGSWPVPTGGGYMIGIDWASSECLVEDCISIDTCKSIVARAAGAGCVVGYNYTDDQWDAYSQPTTDAAWQECGINASHFIGPHHVLFEGNHAPNFDSDYTHGGSNLHTVLRNYLPGIRRNFTWDVNPGPSNTSQGANVRAVGLAAYSWDMSFIGNVLGYSGLVSAQWDYTSPAMTCDAGGGNCTGGSNNWASKGAIWKLGYDPIGWLYPDLYTITSAIRDGNWDWLTSSQRWHNTPATFTIPNSYYLGSAPPIFVAHSNTWPWVNPATGATFVLPAKARFDAGTPNGS